MTEKVDFDNYSDDYLKLMNEQHSKFGDIAYYSEHKAIITRNIVNKKVQTILEFGCGIGRNLPYLQKQFKNAKIYGSDISIESLERAKKNNPNITFIDEQELEKYKNKFDLIFIAGVYHHITPMLREDVTNKIVQLMSDDSILICFEHNPYNPLTRKMVNTCEFDKDAVLLTLKEAKELFIKSGLHELESAYTLFVPPKLKQFNFIESFFKWLPFGGQYYVALKKEINDKSAD